MISRFCVIRHSLSLFESFNCKLSPKVMNTIVPGPMRDGRLLKPNEVRGTFVQSRICEAECWRTEKLWKLQSCRCPI